MNSLTLRVGLIAALVVAVFAGLTALALERAFRDSATQAVTQRLQGQLYLLMGAVEVDADGGVRVPERLPEARLNLPDSGLYARITGRDGEVLWRSPSSLGEDVDAVGEAPFRARMTVTWETGGGGVPLTFTVAQDRAALEAQLGSYRRSLWGWLAALAVLLLAAQSLALYLGLKPLRRVARELRAIERGEQSRLAGRYPLELRALTDNLNALIHEERARQARYRDGLADLAHSLKTPLAVLRGTLGVDGDAAGRQALEQLERMDRIVAYQLQRAGTTGRSPLAAPLAVAPVVRRLADSLAKVYAERGVECTLEVPEAARFRGSEGDLMELLGNLMDNAWKFCRRRVRVRAREDDGGLELRVEDDGPGIDPAQVPAILARGGRLDEGVPGQGIGMAVVSEIVQAYDGHLELDGSPQWGGAAWVLRLPG